MYEGTKHVWEYQACMGVGQCRTDPVQTVGYMWWSVYVPISENSRKYALSASSKAPDDVKKRKT